MFDGSLAQSYIAELGRFDCVKNDIFITVSTDGFEAYKNRTCDVWPVVAVLLNLPPSSRYKMRNVIPLMFIPHGKEPKDLQSYLIPLLNELQSLERSNGVELRFYDGSIRQVRIHLLFFTADLVAMKRLLSISGHNGKAPCRFCKVVGSYLPQSNRYYFMSTIRDSLSDEPNVLYDLRNLPLRSPNSISETIRRIESASQKQDADAISKATGIQGSLRLCTLRSLVPFKSFPPDIMHLFYNVQKFLLEHIILTEGEEFSLPRADLSFLDEQIVSFGKGVSGQTTAKPRPLSVFARWKSHEHKTFGLLYCLPLFDGYLSPTCLDGLSLFVRLMDISFRPIISEIEANEMSSLAVRFLEHYECFYAKRLRERLNYCRYIIHLLLHLGTSTIECGPLICTSQYWVERYIGWIMDRSHAPYLAPKSMFNDALYGEAHKLFLKHPFQVDEDMESTTALSGVSVKFSLSFHLMAATSRSQEDVATLFYEKTCWYFNGNGTYYC